MQQKIFSSKQSRKIPSARRGQVLVSFAFLVPIILLFVGLALDLGWYYLNVSRLQNAADAAALAGAHTIIDSNSTKFKDLAPVLVPPPESSTGTTTATTDTEPITTTTETTETKDGVTTTITVTTTENPDGSKVVNTVTVVEDDKGTTTTTTKETTSTPNYADIDTTKGHLTARNYVVKNLGETQDVQADADETVNLIIDKWNTFKQPSDRKVDTDLNLIEKDNAFYYRVTLTENIRHFFLPGWFDGMEAKVVAYALLDKNSTVEYSNDSTVTEKEQEKLVDILNKNVIVGNWEVQNYYRQQKSSTKTDQETNETITIWKYPNWDDYKARFSREQYTGAWNHFQDLHNHFTKGYHIRTETVVIQDDLVLDNNANIIRWGENSNVVATAATINNDPTSSAYNPEQSNVLATYKTGETEKKSKAGLPYVWQRLDSINVDFVPDVEFRTTSKYLSQDWDCFLTDADANDQKEVNGWSAHTDWQDGVDRSYLRIHNSIRFETPYKVRENIVANTDETEGDQDVLWGRIESETMLYHPDAGNGLEGKVTIRSLNSVRQLIINFNQSNYNTAAQKYRPVILFYDGPERYSTDNSIRDSKPIILNFNVPFRFILYAPNSPVVILGKEKEGLRGFIVAKKYMRLKKEDDFIFSHCRYFGDGGRREEYFATDQTDKNGNTIYQKANGTGNKKIESQLYKEEVYHSVDSNDTADYYKLTEDGIEMFTDNYGNVQFTELTNYETKIGEYDTFGRTDFTTHNYHIQKELANNMLLSGK